MTKTLIDANVILRYILHDNEEMTRIADEVINEGAFTLPEILAEVVYVLRGVYNFERQDISKSLIEVLEEVDVEPYEIMICALEIFANTNLDFVDCEILAYHEIGGVEFLSFDKKLNNQCKQRDLKNTLD